MRAPCGHREGTVRAPYIRRATCTSPSEVRFYTSRPPLCVDVPGRLRGQSLVVLWSLMCGCGFGAVARPFVRRRPSVRQSSVVFRPSSVGRPPVCPSSVRQSSVFFRPSYIGASFVRPSFVGPSARPSVVRRSSVRRQSSVRMRALANTCVYSFTLDHGKVQSDYG